MSKSKFSKLEANRETTIVEAMKKINENAQGILFVVDEENRLLGCVSDGDLRRSIISDGLLNKKLEKMMNRFPQVILSTMENKTIDWEIYGRITVIPIVDKERRILRYEYNPKTKAFVSKKRSELLKDISVIIMAGGKGTRLYPFTKILPKPLIPIGEIPILERIINRFIYNGINDFYLTVNYKKEMIKSYFEDLSPEYNLKYVEEDIPLGTAGSLKLITHRFDKPVFVTNCDTLIDTDYEDVYKYHVETKSAVTVVSAVKQIRVPYGVLYTGKNGEIQNMEEKPFVSFLINTGMYIINPELFKFIPDKEMFHMPQLISELMKRSYKVSSYPIPEDSFLDMGEFEEMKYMEEKILGK